MPIRQELKQKQGAHILLLLLLCLYIPTQENQNHFAPKSKMDKDEGGDASTAATQPSSDETYLTTYHLDAPPSGLTEDEFEELKDFVAEFHIYKLSRGRCSSLLGQRVRAPPEAVWSFVRQFDKPQSYKHFIKRCTVSEGFTMKLGCTREVNVISGLPADNSTERLDIHDDERRVIGFSIIGGDHRLRNYRSVTSVHGLEREGQIWSVVLESYAVDVPPENSEADTRLLVDTVVRFNLQKLASVTEGINPGSAD